MIPNKDNDDIRELLDSMSLIHAWHGQLIDQAHKLVNTGRPSTYKAKKARKPKISAPPKKSKD